MLKVKLLKSEQEPFWWAKSAFGTSSFDGICIVLCTCISFLALKIQRKEKDKIITKAI